MLKLLYVFLLQSVIGLIVYKWQDPLHLCKVIIFASITMVDIAVDFSKREGYLLQPQKSVLIPINTCKK
jgi:hypothetical protein